MKLHLPCALRGALLACFSVACTTPAWAASLSDQENPIEWAGTNGWLWDSAPYLSTEEMTDTSFTLGPAWSDTETDRPLSIDATIGTVTLKAGDTLEVKSNWWQADQNNGAGHNFTNLVFNKVTVVGDGSATLTLAANNVLAITSTLPDNITINVDGTLGISFTDWDASSTLINGTGDGGIIELYGNIDTTSGKYDISDLQSPGDSKTFEDIFTNYESVDTSQYSKENLSFQLSSNSELWGVTSEVGYNSTLEWQEDGTLDLTVKYVGIGRKVQGATQIPTTPPTADFIASDETSGVLSPITNTDDGGGTWNIQLHGMVLKPDANTPDVILLTTASSGISDTFTTEDKLKAGNFAIVLTSSGEIVLHRSNAVTKDEESTKGAMATTWTIGNLNTEDWTIMEFSLNLSYTETGTNNAFKQILFKPTDADDNAISYLTLYDSSGNEILSGNGTAVATLSYGYVDIGGTISTSILTSSVYTRLTENSYVSLSNPDSAPPKGSSPLPELPVDPNAVSWCITQNASASIEDLRNGMYMDYDTGSYVKMKDDEKILFSGGTLTTVGAEVVLSNPLAVDDGKSVKLAPGANSQLTISRGEQALKTAATQVFHGLEIGGGTNSKVILQNVSSTTPENITIHAGGTLEFYGANTYTIDADKNNILAGGSVGVGGGGTLVFLGKADGSSAIGGLFSDDGTVQVERSVKADSITASKLNIAEVSSVTATQGVVANTINVADGASLASGTAIATKGLSMGEASEVTATGSINANNGAISMGANSYLTSGGDVAGSDVTLAENAKLVADTLTASGFTKADNAGSSINVNKLNSKFLWAWNGGIVDVGNGELTTTGGTTLTAGGVITSSNVTIEANPDVNMGYATFSKGIHLTGNTLTADISSGAIITISAASAKTRAAADAEISIAEMSNTTINAAGNVVVNGSQLTSSSISVTDGALALTNVVQDTASVISVTGTGAQLELTGTSIAKGAAITVGGSTYEAIHSLTATGTAKNGVLTLSSLSADISDLDENDLNTANGMVFLTSNGTGTVKMDSSDASLTFAPGILGELNVVGDNLVLSLWDASADIIDDISESENATTAASVLAASPRTAGGAMDEIYDYLRDTSRATAEQRKAVLDQLSSGSIAMLADSQRRGVTNTINNLRNRVIQMGNEQGTEPEKNIHAWIEADGAYNDIDQDGGAAGYEFQTWGGTVGAHADVGNFSLGAAVSAAYGDLTAHSVDRAEGDHDTLTASLFARHQHGRLTQMGILSFGRNELDVTRHVHTYEAEGTANGHTITAYYEAGYTLTLDEDGAQVLQPLVSVMLTSARMGEFSESGSIGDAGLRCDSETYFYGTVGLGARYQAVLGTDVNDRVAFVEARAKVVADFGDDTHEANVSYVGAPGTNFSLYGAEVGKVGVQLGAGISIPMGIYRTFFADVDLDLRDCATSVSGSVGMRFEF